MAKMTKQQIAEAIDNLGNVRAKMALLETQEKALKAALMSALKPGSIVNGERFFVTYTNKPYRTVDAAACMKALGAAKYLMVSSVSVSKLDNLAPSIAAKLATTEQRPTLAVKVLPE